MRMFFLTLLFIFTIGMIWCESGAKPNAPTLMAMCSLSPASNSRVKGWVKFTQMNGYIKVESVVNGLSAGKHGFHVHEMGDCSSNDAVSAGGHFNPAHKSHGAPGNRDRHIGDLGNITADRNGTANIDLKDFVIRLKGDDSIIGRSLIIHADEDDMKTQPTGNSGKRVACGVIQPMKLENL